MELLERKGSRTIMYKNKQYVPTKFVLLKYYCYYQWLNSKAS